MNPDPAAAGTDGIALALAFARAPSGFPDLLHGRGRLPAGMTALLQVAAGTPVPHSASTPFDAVGGEPQKAAQFFIEQVLLAHNATHYRMLGVAPAASAEEIKEHHRLLMRLFHPDRQTKPDERTNSLATRINQAYNVLRSPDQRAAYDQSLKDKREVKAVVPRYRSRAQPVDDRSLLMRMPPLVARHLPQFALGSVALAAALGVMLVYLNRVPTDASGAGDSTLARAPQSDALRIMPPNLPPAVTRAMAEPNPAEQAPPKAVPAVSDRPLAPRMMTAENSLERESAVMPAALPQLAAAKPVADRPAPPTVVAPARRSESPSSPAAIGATEGPAAAPTPTAAPPAAPEPAAMPAPTPSTAVSVAAVAATAPPAPPQVRPEPLRPDQLNRLLASLAEQYQQGDLEKLLELFDASARIERGDRRQIRAEYGELFRNSESRVLHIWDVAWSGDGKLARGEGSFQARVLRKGERAPQIYSGAVTIEVVHRNDKPLIVGLYHKVDQ